MMDRDLELGIVSGLRRGDPEAFDALHDAFHARLFNFLARMANSRDVAEDRADEVWLRVVEHGRRLQPDTRLAPWLFTIARHLCASHRRSRMVEDAHAPGLIGLWPSGSSDRSPLEAVEATEARRRLVAALAALPAASREVLLLVGVEGMAPAEAAAVCGVTPEAMRQRLHRARRLLSRQLSESDFPGLASLRELTI
jgi:RNA polymerase sigma-70 factor (ECF subfamily)